MLNKNFFGLLLIVIVSCGKSGEEGLQSKVYLTALDKDLNMLGETLLPQLTKKPGKHFAKDGKIWMYENMENEMGFVRLQVKNKNFR